MVSGSNWIGSARLQHLRATGPVEQAVAPRPWKTLRVFHFPTASTAGRTLPFDRSFGNIFKRGNMRVLIVADHWEESARQAYSNEAACPSLMLRRALDDASGPTLEWLLRLSTQCLSQE